MKDFPKINIPNNTIAMLKQKEGQQGENTNKNSSDNESNDGEAKKDQPLNFLKKTNKTDFLARRQLKEGIKPLKTSSFNSLLKNNANEKNPNEEKE